eukprot:CAMPEP_0184197822 /NCGR_PEP_ID=MMETSP0976-20121227/6208_1 /TAXON_ID=483370 /ORGANISM="non described non described, Strain CCMP2097" /LENGTH=56 /DNA_ID=CAMNT_0026502299 /DNA_START=135 /DNA_END=301 /DNA_ORIENTATION=+
MQTAHVPRQSGASSLGAPAFAAAVAVSPTADKRAFKPAAGATSATMAGSSLTFFAG